MRTLDHIHSGHYGSEGRVSFSKSLLSRISRLSESIWLGITFLLFIIMGPFSVIAVLYGLWSLATGENKERMIAPVRC